MLIEIGIKQLEHRQVYYCQIMGSRIKAVNPVIRCLMTPKTDKTTLTLATISYLANLYNCVAGHRFFADLLPEWFVSLLNELFTELKFVSLTLRNQLTSVVVNGTGEWTATPLWWLFRLWQ